MLCDFQPQDGKLVCAFCGRTVNGPGPVRAHCWQRREAAPPPPPAPAKPRRTPFAGPGRELTRLIRETGLKEKAQCQCDRRARQMNEWGIEGCREQTNTIAGWLRESFEQLGWREKLSAAAALAGKLDWLHPVESLIELAISRAEAKTLTVLVLGHERAALDKIITARHLAPINLNEIETDNRLAESRIFLRPSAFDHSSAFIGLASASWNRKYGPTEPSRGRKWPHCLPLERLDELEIGAPNVVWCAAITDDEQWSQDLDALFPGCDALVNELIAHFGLRHRERLGPLANNFIAHRSVTLDHARWMKSVIEYLDSRYGRDWPVSGALHPCFADRLPAFMGECASILYFANRPDLELRQIPPPT